jgi:site-specific DNA recombinase
MAARCAIYARYSSDQQRRESIEDQIRHCRQAAANRPDWIVLDDQIYADEAVSGASVEGRTALGRLIQAARSPNRPFDLVIADDTSRLARDTVDALMLLRQLRSFGVKYFFVNQNVDSEASNAELLATIHGAFDHEYIRELGRKTHRGLEGQARKGFSAGGLPFGYRREIIVDPDQSGGHGEPRRRGVKWVVDPAQAGVVTRIFSLYADGMGLARIAGTLNMDAIPCPRAAKRHRARRDGVGVGWDVSTIRVILDNEIYRGKFIWNRSRWIRDTVSRRRRRVPRDTAEHIVRDEPELRIVSDDLWARAQARRAEIRAQISDPTRFGRSRSKYGEHLLSGLLVCAICETLLTIRTGSRHRGDQRYGCTRRWRRGTSACSNNVFVRRDLVERRVIELLQDKLYSPDAVQRLMLKVNHRLRQQRPALADRFTELSSKLSEVNKRLENVRRFIENGDSSHTVRQWLTDLELEQARIRRHLAEVEAESTAQPLQVHPARIDAYLRDLVATLKFICDRPPAGTGEPALSRASDGLQEYTGYIPPGYREGIPLGAPGSANKAESMLRRARTLLKADIERIVVHPVRPETGKPFARAEVVSTGKGLLQRVAFVVAGAGFEPATFGL